MELLGTKTIETDRLILRKFQISDAEQMYTNWATDENTNRYVSWPMHKSVEETRTIVQNWIAEYEEISFNWVVELKETHEIIGNIMVISISLKHSNCEIGYCYGSAYWGNGYATEALKAVIDYLLSECKFHVVEAKHLSLNPASGRVMEKAGMVKEATLKERRFHKASGQYCDLIIYIKM